MAIVLPHTFEDGPTHIASGVQVMDNLNALKAAIEGIGESQSQSDAFQAGVLSATDWPLKAFTINGASGVMAVPGSYGGAAWLPGPVSGLVRTYTVPAPLSGLTPPFLPAPGGFVCAGVELTATGAIAKASVVCGVEKGTAAEALAAPPPTTSGKMRVIDVVVRNVAGVYSFAEGVNSRDRRPWARGAYALLKRTSGFIFAKVAATPLDAGALSLRLECSGAPVRFRLHAVGSSGEEHKGLSVGLRMDGAALDGTLDGNIEGIATGNTTLLTEMALDLAYDFAPAPGSHLFQPTGMTSKEGGGEGFPSSGNQPILFSVEEIVRPNANNGTA